MIKLYLIRHGECEGKGLYIGRGSDVSLTAEGFTQIKNINMGEIDLLYTSPMKRCLESSNIISQSTGIKAEILTDLEEIDFGDWEGLSFKKIETVAPIEYKKWYQNPIDNRPPSGESLLELQKRVLDSLPSFSKLINDERVWNVIIVSHKGPLSILLLHFLQLDLKFFWSFKIDRGSTTKLNLYQKFSEVEYLNKKET